MINRYVQYERIGLATEKLDILTSLPLNISGAITGNSKMKVISRTRDKNGRYAQESCVKVVKCERCANTFRQIKGHRRFCSQYCYWDKKRYIDPQGYVCIKKPEHPHATSNGWVREHIVIACNMIGRSLLRGECVHHIDRNRQNNKPENLKVMFLGEHIQEHFGNPANRKYGKPNLIVECMCGCGGVFPRYDKKGRPRKYVRGHYRRK